MRETVANFVTHAQIDAAMPTANPHKPRIESDYLFRGKSEIVIVHQNQEYSLRITRNGKLILTK